VEVTDGPGSRRKALKREYRDAPPDAGVYRIVNERDGRSLVASTLNLASAANRFEFARATDTRGALDGRLAADITAHGIGAFSFEILQRLEPAPGATKAAIERDLAAMEQLWRDHFGPSGLY